MKNLFLSGSIFLLTLSFSMSVQAQTLEERVTTLETQMGNVELLSTQLFTLFTNQQADLLNTLEVVSENQEEISKLRADLTTAEQDLAVAQATIASLQSSNTTLINEVNELQTRFNGVTRTGSQLLFTGMNLQVVSGSGST